jgi:tetratricopeptide (TPR) repeat protein
MDLATALALHQAGRTAEAESAYRTLLATTPQDPTLLHAYGVLRHQRGDSEGALPFLAQAAHLAPNTPEHHFNHGLALFRLARFDQAAAAFTHATRLKPDWPQPYYDLGNALHAAGKLEQAAASFRAALKRRPDFFQAEINLGNTLQTLGKTEQAIAAYQRVLRRHPDLPEIHSNLGAALLAQNAAQAETHFHKALALNPAFPESLASLTRLLLTAERWPEAVTTAAQARAAHPTRADFAEMHADALRGANQLDAALRAYETALRLAPTRHSARFGLAETHRLKRDFPAAETILRQLAEILPTTWLAHHDLGNALRDQGKFAQAETSYRAALALAETPIVLNHLAAVLRDLGRLDEARLTAERGLALAPNHQDLRYNLAITHLTAGRLLDGFALYDVRFAKYRVAPLPGRPWTGQNLRGRTILVAAEQGLGDTIQFIRYLPALAATGARIKLRLPATLIPLLADFPGVAELHDQSAPLPTYDFHVALLSLPDRLRLADPCPIPTPYLAADTAQTHKWQRRLAADLPGLRVGLAWAGNPGFAADHLRSIPPAQLTPLRSAQGVSFVSLQKGALEKPDLPLTDWTAELTTMADTACLIAALDAVVSVDTAIAHLAGALGKPVILLNRFDTCWRWGTASQNCLWYPGVRQCRQPVPGDWDTPLRQAAHHLSSITQPPY